MDINGLPVPIVESRREIILEDDESGQIAQKSALEDYTKFLSADDRMGSLSEKRRYVADYAKFLTREDFIELGRIIKEENCLSLVKENSDGCRVDLSKVTSETLLNKLFAAVKYKIAQRK